MLSKNNKNILKLTQNIHIMTNQNRNLNAQLNSIDLTEIGIFFKEETTRSGIYSRALNRNMIEIETPEAKDFALSILKNHFPGKKFKTASLHMAIGRKRRVLSLEVYSTDSKTDIFRKAKAYMVLLNPYSVCNEISLHLEELEHNGHKYYYLEPLDIFAYLKQGTDYFFCEAERNIIKHLSNI